MLEDKQIIIDGVDVSGCEFYSYIESNKYPHRCSCYEDMYGCSVVCDLADCCKNCHYKQLKRKEQECEELKKIINVAKNSKLDLKSFLVGEAVQNEYEEQLDQLKAENEELKEAYKKLNNMYNENCNYTGKVEQAIERIKELAKDKLKWCKDNKKICLDCVVTCRERQILRICDEVK